MKNNLFEIEIQTSKIEGTNHLYDGTLSLTPKEPVFLTQIGGKLFQKIDGYRTSKLDSINSFTISTEKQQLQIGQVYTFPFRFLKRPDYGIYKGENMAVYLEMQIIVEYEKENAKKLEKKIPISRNSIVIKITDKQDYIHSQLLELYSEETTHMVNNNSGNFVLDGNASVWVLCFIAWYFSYFLFVGFTFSGEHFLGLIFWLFVAIILASFTHILLFKSLLGHFKIEIQSQNQEQFLSLIESKRNWLFLSKATLNYEIVEEVSNGEGKTKSFKLYSSAPTTLLLKDRSVQNIHFFPSIAPMPTVKMENAAINWRMILEATTIFGLKVTYGKEFK